MSIVFMGRYYTEKLAGERLKRCYELAPPAVRAYLQAEIDFVRQKVRPRDRLLELGCGYGRVMKQLAPFVAKAVGIDTSWLSLDLARRYLEGLPNCLLVGMNATTMGFRSGFFDCVICVQNGLSAFQVNQRELIRAAMHVARPGGVAIFSSYSDRFWQERLQWFRIQAEQGLIGEIDEQATRNGVIVCKDGFRATTVPPRELAGLTDGLGKRVTIAEVAQSSLFCEIIV